MSVELQRCPYASKSNAIELDCRVSLCVIGDPPLAGTGCRELTIVGSEASTPQSAANFRVEDLTADLLSEFHHWDWVPEAKTARHDEAVADLKSRIGV